MTKSDLVLSPIQTAWGYIQGSNDHLPFNAHVNRVPGETGGVHVDGAHAHPLGPQDLIFVDGGAPGVSVVRGQSSLKAGPAGVMTATSDWFTPVPFTAGAPGAFNIRVEFKGTWTKPLEAGFETAAKLLASYIVGDLPDVRYNGKVIDDIVITAELKGIDGVGNILGQAGPTGLRAGGSLPSSYLPAMASMQFDSADALNFQGQALWDDIVTHEMLHSLGFGSIWSYKGLSDGSLFRGLKAHDVYGRDIPLETSGGAGTAGSHWAEDVFKTELMTGYIGYTDKTDPLHPVTDMHNSISSVTWASMADLGYQLSSYTPHDMWG